MSGNTKLEQAIEAFRNAGGILKMSEVCNSESIVASFTHPSFN